MKSRKWIGFGIAFSFTLIAVSSLLYMQNEGEADLASKKKAKSQRPLELTDATKKSSPLVSEDKVLMNDPALAQAWGIQKSSALKAWSVSQGSADIWVAVIDTGIDTNHEDLKKNLWVNKGETGLDSKGRDKATNGIDDDGNGCVDDVHGCNLITKTGDLTDNHGHGTHIAGIIGAEAGNGKGIAGISPKVSLMILKYYDPKVPNADNLKNTVAAIRYAIKNGAKIINYSGGGTEFSQEEKDAIEEARKNGVLFVAAAGNERSNSDHHKYYPADYGLSNIISVTAIDPLTEVLPSSNYGVETVDIAAPGQNILSTLPNNSYGYMTGTSQATAFVTGAAVLTMAHHPEFQPDEIKKYILATGDSTPSLLAKTRTSRQLNLYKALTMMDSQTTASGLMATSSSPSIPSTTQSNVSDQSLDEGNREIAAFGKSLLKTLENENKKN